MADKHSSDDSSRPAIVQAEAVDRWTQKPFCTVLLHRGEHEFSLARDEDGQLVARVFNTTQD